MNTNWRRWCYGVWSVRLAVAFVLAVPLAGCSAFDVTIQPEFAAQAVTDHVARETGFRPSDVSCPSGVYVDANTEFECHYTGSDGEPYTARLRIANPSRGDAPGFHIEIRPS